MKSNNAKMNEMMKNIPCDIYKDSLPSFVFTQPTQFVLFDEEVKASTWVELIDCLCSRLMKWNREKFEEFLADEICRQRRNAYLAREEQYIHFVRLLEKSGLYLNCKIDAPRSVKLICSLFEKFDINKDEFCLTLKDCEGRVQKRGAV